MIASEIPSVIESFIKEENPYHCILIDGAWGIGKSFQIDKALKEIPCSISISLFGITTVDEIMTQLAVRICSGAKKGTTIANQIPKLSTILGEIDIGPISSIAKILSTAVSPQIVLDTLLRKSKKDQPLLIVFDDIERINSNLDVDLFLGIVETVLLRKENKDIKVLFVANLEQMPPKAKSIWDKYSEKLVNRSYFVDELANEIEFFSSQKQNEMALAFLYQHGCKNLRTLQKAENFFLDVKYQINLGASELLQNESAIDSLRFACYATVLECTEKIYEREYQRQKGGKTGKDNLTSKIYFEIENRSVESRVCFKYLFSDQLATIFAPYLIAYFEKGNLDLKGILSAYGKYTKGEKPVYYMSDAEVREHVGQDTVDLREGNYNSLFDFLKKADSVYIWSEVLNLETHDIERMVSEEVPKEYEKLLSQKGRKLDFTLSSIFSDEIQSSQMKSFLTNFGEKEMAIYVKWLKKQFESSLESGDYTKIYQQLDEIEMIFQKLQRKGQTNVIVQFLEFFCNEWLLPIGSISENQYHCCQKSYALAMTYFPEQYSSFLQETMSRYSENHMFLDRMKYIKQNYDEHLHD